MLHDRFGDGEYWAARRSMRFSPRLVDRAAQFRLECRHGPIREQGW